MKRETNIYISSIKNIYAGVTFKSQLHEFLLALTQNSQDLEKSTCSHNSKANEASRGPKKLSIDISLCVLYKILERLIYARLESIIDPLLSSEYPGFRCGKSTLDQVILLTENIKDFFVNLSI